TRPEEPPVDDYFTADIADFDAVRPALTGMDAVIHLAAQGSPYAEWDEVREKNISGTYNVFESARQAGATKIVFASTNHVMGMYDRDGQWPIYANQPVRPDSLYGVSKAFGENLGRYYYDQYGISVICLRIGWFLTEPRDDFGEWSILTPRDCAQIVEKALEADLGYGIFYAISGNAGRNWDITDAIVKLGYRPEDDGARMSD
ncbi:MAG: NAD(P)-dependent oxidoreductase, partial [Thermomicrobiales bacterium]